MARAIQGDATNSDSPQTRKQRTEFGALVGDQSFGASDTARLQTLFSTAPSPDRIMRRANNRHKIGSFSGAPAGENPDFPEGITGQQLLKFEKGEDKFRAITVAKDKPNFFGPNLVPPDISNLPDDVSGPVSPAQETSPTALVDNDDEYQGRSYSSKGFGTEIRMNDPRIPVRQTSFLGRRDSGVYGTLGEWYDTSKYDYSELPVAEEGEDAVEDE